MNNPRGLANLLAYGLGVNPVTGVLLTSNQVDPVPSLVLSLDEPPFAGLEFHLPVNPPTDLCYIVEESSTLTGDWNELGARAGNGTWVGPGFITEGAAVDGLRNQQVYSTFTVDEQNRNFYRLRIELIGHEE